MAASSWGSPAPAGMVPAACSWMLFRLWFPRTRGDGPQAEADRDIPKLVPPHPRGWSRGSVPPADRMTGSPAPAGMVPRRERRCCSDRRFPRTRGDGPPALIRLTTSQSVPPHPRGWSLPSDPERDALRGSPAPAGMVPFRALPSRRRKRFPRTRGDGPLHGTTHAITKPVPPHPRGWSPWKRWLATDGVGSPAPAGMVRCSATASCAGKGFPRTRGDGPAPGTWRTRTSLVPPHPRGWSHLGHEGREHGEGSPAPAGMVPTSGLAGRPGIRFPRTRGDGPLKE